MRLPPLAPDQLSAEQRPLFETMREGVHKHLKGFISEEPNGALIGPFPAMLHFPQFGKAAVGGLYGRWRSIRRCRSPAHEVAILVTGVRYNSRYELYSHERVAAAAGLSASKIATITAGAAADGSGMRRRRSRTTWRRC